MALSLREKSTISRRIKENVAKLSAGGLSLREKSTVSRAIKEDVALLIGDTLLVPQPLSAIDTDPDLETFTAEDLIPDGDDNTVKTAKGTKVSTGFAVIEANKLIVSHDNQGNENPDYPYELQPRDRKRAESVAWVLKTAKNLDVDSLGKTRRADSGEPIITDLLAQSPITQEQAETWANAQIIDKSSLKPLQN